MIIYLASTKLTNKEDWQLLKKIKSILINNKYKILGNDSNKFSPENLLKRTENEIKKQYMQMSGDIRKSTAFIALVTAQSVEIGKEISEAIQEKVPTLILFSGKTLDEKIQIPGDKKNLITYKKVTEKKLQEIIEQFINEVRKQTSTRFTLVIPSNIDKYINWLAKEESISKAAVLRDAVNEIRKKDGKYETYLEDAE